MKSLIATTLVLLLLLFSGGSQKANDPADVQAIKEVAAAWDKVWNAGNAEALASFYTADAIAMGPNHPALLGKDAIRTSSRKYFDQFREENRSVVEDVRVSGDLAVARGTQETITKPKAGGNSVQDKAKWITAFERQPDRSWKVLWEIYNSDLPAADSLPIGVEEQALMKIERDMAEWTIKNDWAAFDKMLAAEYVTSTDGVTTLKKQFLGNVRGRAYKVASLTAAEMKVLVCGETGVAHGLWVEKSTLNGRNSSGTYRRTDIFAKRDGRWQCVTSHNTRVQ